MSTLSELEYRVGRYYRDVTHAMVTNTEIDEALQQALDEFTQVQPLTRETVVLLASAGREIPLDELDGLLDVVTVWWPYDLTTEIWPPNIVNGFRLYWDDNRPVLLFDDHTVTPPAAGQYIRLWYTVPHSIQNLNGGEATTITPHLESLLVRGAVAYATISKTLDLRTDKALVDKAKQLVKDFKTDLAAAPKRKANVDFGGVTGWSVDDYDLRRGRSWTEMPR